MNRRLFVGQCTAGLALQLVPSLVIANPFSPAQASQPANAGFIDKAASLIQQGSLGTSQRITFTHTYSPERTSLSSLLAMIRQNFDLVRQLVGIDVVVDPALLPDVSAQDHGSYSFRVDNIAGVAITWQALARFGVQSGDPISTLHIMGNKGALHINMDASSYKLINFQGRVVQSENQSTRTSRLITRRNLLGV